MANNGNWQQKCRYKFDTFMAKGGFSVFTSLLLVFVAILIGVTLLRWLLIAVFGDSHAVGAGMDLWRNMYIVFLEITDPGNMAYDVNSSPLYKFAAIVAGLSGVIMLSALIAFITTALDQKLSELKRGHSKVIEEEHTLILGWNEQRVVEIIRELLIANESEDDACVVILADEDKEVMDDVLRLRFPDTKTTRLVTRRGNVSDVANLEIVSVKEAKSVIVVASCQATDTEEDKAGSDAKAIQTILAITMMRGTNETEDDEDEEFCIVAEIFNPTHRRIVSETFSDSIVTVDTQDILAKILVQTSRSVGLSLVYNEILSFDGCEMYFYGADWGDITFGKMAFHFPDGVPMGIRHGDHSLTMNPDCDYKMKEDDEILILADDDSTIDYRKEPLAQAKEYDLAGGRLEQKLERELIIGWTSKAPVVLEQYADYVKEGSQIDIMLLNPPDEIVRQIEESSKDLDNIDVSLVRKNCLDTDDLMSVKPFQYDNIVILAEGNSEHNDVHRVDSENIVTLLLLREIFKRNPVESESTKLITEVLDSQNYPLVAQAGVKDVIISNRLISMVLAQISESKDIMKVYDDIFEEDGSEIYLKPMPLYFKELPIEVSFADLMRIAQKRKEVCLGVKIKALERDTDKNCGVRLIPPKSERFTLTADDSIVVLAEDEL